MTTPLPTPSTDPPASAEPARVVLRGSPLRAQLTLILDQAREPVTLSWLIEQLHIRGVEPPGRASKAVSDALRWEIRYGRVAQRGRGVYQVSTVTRQHRHRFRKRVARAIAAARPGTDARIDGWPLDQG